MRAIGLDVIFASEPFINLGSVIVHAISDERPAVVLALLDEINFVSAPAAMLGIPRLAWLGIDCKSLRSAVSQTPDIRHGEVLVIAPLIEGVAGRRVTFSVNSQFLAHQ